ncbi:MAG: RNA polymerase sigma factor [Trebonia sp.]
MSADVSDGDLVRLAQGGDAVSFRLLIERHQAMVRARARQSATDPGNVDDIVQESFLQAFLALGRLRDPDRFGAWLAGIVRNVARGLRRRAPVTLLPEWPEPLHPVSADGLPSAEDMDRADALRAAVADLPAGQRRAVALHYYADVPAGRVGEPPGAGRASGRFRIADGAGRAGLFMRVTQPRDIPFTAQAATADPANHIVALDGRGEWAIHEVTAPVPEDASTVVFGVFLAGPGAIELQDAEFTGAVEL